MNLIRNCHILFIAFGGDITCDFESNESFEGHCNWQYSFLSRNTLEWYIDSDHSRPKWENGKRIAEICNEFLLILYDFSGNHAVRLLGKGFVAIHSTADFSCSSIGTQKTFGFMYKLQSSNVSTLISIQDRFFL